MTVLNPLRLFPSPSTPTLVYDAIRELVIQRSQHLIARLFPSWTGRGGSITLSTMESRKGLCQAYKIAAQILAESRL